MNRFSTGPVSGNEGGKTLIDALQREAHYRLRLLAATFAMKAAWLSAMCSMQHGAMDGGEVARRAAQGLGGAARRADLMGTSWREQTPQFL